MIVGIDPGYTGAIAHINNLNKEVIIDMPIIKNKGKQGYDVAALRVIIGAFAAMSDCHVFIEKAQVMPGQGIVSSSNYLYGYGVLIGMLEMARIPYTEVRPQVWKKELMAGMPKEKHQSIIRALQIFPNAKLDKKKHHGRADALLIATYGRSLHTRRVAPFRRSEHE